VWSLNKHLRQMSRPFLRMTLRHMSVDKGVQSVWAKKEGAFWLLQPLQTVPSCCFCSFRRRTSVNTHMTRCPSHRVRFAIWKQGADEHLPFSHPALCLFQTFSLVQLPGQLHFCQGSHKSRFLVNGPTTCCRMKPKPPDGCALRKRDDFL
jgi:hypothetical protein